MPPLLADAGETEYNRKILSCAHATAYNSSTHRRRRRSSFCELCSSLSQAADSSLPDRLHTRFVRWTKPFTPSLLLLTIADLGRSKSELMAENALLRQRLIILKRQVKRPACTKRDRILLVLLARAVRALQQTLFIVQPDTLLRWHRELFRLYWKRRSKASPHKPKVATETIVLIREMAKENQRLQC
jgi:hypothetical protein